MAVSWGAASLGAVVAFITLDRAALMPAASLPRIRLALWALVLAAGTSFVTIFIAGPPVLTWLATGALVGASARLCVNLHARAVEQRTGAAIGKEAS